MRIDLGRIKLFAEIGAAVAVVLSLAFVGVQVREDAMQTRLNTVALEVTAYQDLISNINELNHLAITDPDVARIQVNRGVSLDSLSPVDRRRQEAMALFMLRHGDMAYYQFEHGLLDRERMDSALAPLRVWLRFCSVQQVWGYSRANFTENYRAYVDGIVTSSPPLNDCPAQPGPSVVAP
ncbi:MAG: hypothetical protein H7124_07905 [Phycisphaerales bacterium]|nr:hypothetical protein [Hyphomonadaceae bacterium]